MYTHIPAAAMMEPITHMNLRQDSGTWRDKAVFHSTHNDMPTLPLNARMVLGVEKILHEVPELAQRREHDQDKKRTQCR